jgi:hypothetical protein
MQVYLAEMLNEVYYHYYKYCAKILDFFMHVIENI